MAQHKEEVMRGSTSIMLGDKLDRQRTFNQCKRHEGHNVVITVSYVAQVWCMDCKDIVIEARDMGES
jgi:hypothetical protein